MFVPWCSYVFNVRQPRKTINVPKEHYLKVKTFCIKNAHNLTQWIVKVTTAAMKEK